MLSPVGQMRYRRTSRRIGCGHRVVQGGKVVRTTRSTSQHTGRLYTLLSATTTEPLHPEQYTRPHLSTSFSQHRNWSPVPAYSYDNEELNNAVLLMLPQVMLWDGRLVRGGTAGLTVY